MSSIIEYIDKQQIDNNESNFDPSLQMNLGTIAEEQVTIPTVAEEQVVMPINNAMSLKQQLRFNLYSQKHLFQPNDDDTRFMLVNEINFDARNIIVYKKIKYNKCIKDLKTGYTYDVTECDHIKTVTLCIDDQNIVYVLDKQTLFYKKQEITRTSSKSIFIYDEHFVNAEDINRKIVWYNKQFMTLCYNDEDKNRIHLRHVVYIKNACGVNAQLVLGFVFVNNNADVISVLWCDHIEGLDTDPNINQTSMAQSLAYINTHTYPTKGSLPTEYQLHINRFTPSEYSSHGLARIITAIFTNIINITKICNRPVRRIISEAVNPISVWLLVYYFKWKMMPVQSTEDIKYLTENNNNVNLRSFNFDNFVQNKWNNIEVNDDNKEQFHKEVNEQFNTTYGKYKSRMRIFIETFVSVEDLQRAKQIEDAYFENNKAVFCDLLKTGEELYNVTSPEDLGNVLSANPYNIGTLYNDNVQSNEDEIISSEFTGGRRRKQKSRKQRNTKNKKQRLQKRRKSIKRL
jgi:hypothetical protein